MIRIQFHGTVSQNGTYLVCAHIKKGHLQQVDASSALLRLGDARFEEHIYVATSDCISQGLDATSYVLRWKRIQG